MAIFGMPGGAEWWIILVVILLLFGPTQIPKLMKTLGKSAKALKEGMDGNLDDEEKAKADAAAVEAAPPPDVASPAKDDEGGTGA